MIRKPLSLLVTSLVGVGAACVVGASGEVPCTTDADCPDLYVCGSSSAGAGQVCVATAPLEGGGSVVVDDGTGGDVTGGGGGGNTGGGGGGNNGGGGTGGTPDAGAGTVAQAVYYCGAVQQALDKYCSTCHGAAPNASGIPTFRTDVYADQGGVQGAKTIAPRISLRLTSTVPMPPVSSPQPTADEKTLLTRWVEGGAKLCADAGM